MLFDMQNIDFDDDEDDMNMEEDAGKISFIGNKGTRRKIFGTFVRKLLIVFFKKKLKSQYSKFNKKKKMNEHKKMKCF